MIDVLIVDDHHLVRAGIRSLLEKHQDINVIAEAADGIEAVEMTRDLSPHVVLMDIGMPRLNGYEATTRIRDLRLPVAVIILSMHSEKTIVHQALENGARGYLLKSSLENELSLAIHAVIQGETYLSPSIASVVLDNYLTLSAENSGNANVLDRLTTRERQLLQLIAEGHTNREAAQILQIGERTVEKHRSNLMDKLDVHDVANLVRIAIKYGLISLNE